MCSLKEITIDFKDLTIEAIIAGMNESETVYTTDVCIVTFSNISVILNRIHGNVTWTNWYARRLLANRIMGSDVTWIKLQSIHLSLYI